MTVVLASEVLSCAGRRACRLFGPLRLKQTLPAVCNALVDDFFRLVSAALATLKQVDGLGYRLLRLNRFPQVATIIDP